MNFPVQPNALLHILLDQAMRLFNFSVPYSYAEQLNPDNEIFLLFDQGYDPRLKWIVQAHLDSFKDFLVIAHITGTRITLLWNTHNIPGAFATGSTLEMTEQTQYVTVDNSTTTTVFTFASKTIFDFRKLTRQNQQLAVETITNSN